MRILIAEDNSLTRMSIALIVENLGYEACGMASDGAEAVKMAANLKPDLILMDINMPGKNGLEALQEISASNDIPCIFVTAYANDSFIKSAAHLGAVGYVTKPVTEEQLRAQIKMGLSQKETLGAAQREAAHYKNALEERKVIERAKGILMDRAGIKEGEAMKRLQKISRDKNQKLIDVAREIVKADELFK